MTAYYAAPRDNSRREPPRNNDVLRLTMDPYDEHVRIASSVEANVWLAGIVTQKNPLQRSRKLAVILHGILSHKNQSYHHQLAAALPIDSIRFDFRGNGASGGEWGIARVGQDVQDIIDVCHTMRTRYGYEVELLVGHSRGALAAWIYLARFEQLRHGFEDVDSVPLFVSLSARWDMRRILDSAGMYQKAFSKEGVFRWSVPAGDGQTRQYSIYPHDLIRAANLPIKAVIERVPASTQVLLMHGTADKTVPMQDCASYLHALESQRGRAPGSVHMHMLQGGDHMLRGCYEAAVQRICSWYHERAAHSDEAVTLTQSTSSSSQQLRGGTFVAQPSLEVARLSSHL